MSEVMVARIGGGAATLYFDIDDVDKDTVIGAHIVTSLPSLKVEVIRHNGKTIEETLPPGDYYRELPKRMQFSYSTEAADWGISLTAPYDG